MAAPSGRRLGERMLMIAFVALLVGAALGEWNVINQVLEGIPKGICAGIILMAMAKAFIRPDIERVKRLLSPTLMYLLLIALLMLWSLAIWIMNFSNFSSIVRGGSKMIFQTISVLTAVSAVYLFGFGAIDLFALGLCIANGLIMLLEVPNYGLAESVRSLVNCIVTFGDAVGFARALEIHDLTFVFGQLMIYYAAFAPVQSAAEKKRRRRLLIACTFFFIVGMKRIAIPAVMLFILVAAILKRKRISARFLIVGGLCITAFFLFFVYAVRSGLVSRILAGFGVNMMGRDYLWQLAGDYYEFSPLYMGKGFEFVDQIVVQWFTDGIINRAYPLHNDILKVFVELGFPGFMIWSLVQYMSFPLFFLKYAGSKATALYLAELGYMSITYMTDNTAFYFWSTMALRLIVLAYAFYQREQRPKETVYWRPPTKAEMQMLVSEMMLEDGRKEDCDD